MNRKVGFFVVASLVIFFLIVVCYWHNVSGDLVRVIRVVDGDTIVIEGKIKVRYIGIDTPETKDPRRLIQYFGKEAAAKNKELVDGKRVRLERDVQDKDKYGRLLRYVWVGGKFVNLELVKQGYARAKPYPPNVKYKNLFRESEKEAKENKKGLWGKG